VVTPGAGGRREGSSKTILRFVLTLLLFALAVWWLIELALQIGTAPTIDAQGKVVVDKFQRAKDILLVVLPLVTSALGYWFGAQGKEQEQERAESARSQLEAVVSASTDPGLLQKARSQYPDAFGLRAKESE
jgi:hypothetical protein